MQHYVCGFLFSPDLKNVVLIKKNKPEWQRGLLNGIGGKINPDEGPSEAMTREFSEEAGVHIPEWHRLCTIMGAEYRVHFFYQQSAQYKHCVTKESEYVLVVPVEDVCYRDKSFIRNLNWLIPLALDMITKESGIIKI